jgi:hypothetical protein
VDVSGYQARNLPRLCHGAPGMAVQLRLARSQNWLLLASGGRDA